MLEFAPLVFFPAMMAYAASSDLITMTIPNKLTAGVAIAYFITALANNTPLETIAIHTACGVGVLLVTFVMFAMGWMGGGDAKLAAATAVWFGWPLVFEYILLSSILGGALTLAILAARGLILPAPLMRHAWIVRLHDQHTGIPYGIALACAALFLYPQSAPWAAAFALS